MANIAKFETAYTAAVTAVLQDDTHEFATAINALDAIADTTRPVLYRGMSKSAIENNCRLAASNIRSELGIGDMEIGIYNPSATNTDGVFLRHSDNNRVGSDFDFYFAADASWVSVELKLGSSTEVACGMSDVNANILFDASSLNDLNNRRDERRKMWMEGNEAEAIAVQRNALVDTAFTNAAFIGSQLSPEGQRQLDAYYRGITISDEIFGDAVKRSVVRMKFTKSGFAFEKLPTENCSDWFLAGITMTKAGRLNFDVLSRKGNCRFRFTLNWKNSYILSNGVKVSARYGLGSPSYNAWRRKPTKTQMEKFFDVQAG